jgi:hypothetical protein
MKMVIPRRQSARAMFIGLAALAAASCAKVSGGASSPGVDDSAAGVTSAAPAPSAPPAPSNVANVATQEVVVPVATDPEAAPAPQVETKVTPASPAVMRAVTTEQGKLEAVTAVLEGTKVRFVDCNEAAACTARLEAQSLAGLRDLLQSVSAQQGGLGFTVREQLDAYAGRTFVADVTLGAATPRAVPTDENELLANEQ